MTPFLRKFLGMNWLLVGISFLLCVLGVIAVYSASAFRTRTPALAPRPIATITDIGVAKPKAQGHAMISTATAEIKACANRGCGPMNAQTAKVTTAAATTAGTK